MLSIMDRAYEESTTTGTGDLTVTGAVANHVTLNSVYGTGNGNTFPYTIENRAAAEWETGIGYLSDGSTLVRDRVVASSNSGAKVNFSAGTKRVFSAMNSTFLQEYVDARINPTTDVPDQVTGLVAEVGDGQITLSWAEPNANGSPITDYLIEYKLDTEPTTWSEWTDTTPLDELVTITGLTNGSLYNFRVSAINAIGTGAVSAETDATPVISSDIESIITTGMVAFWDGKVYAGSGDWLNQIGTPADGSAQADYDVAPTNAALWDSNKWVMDNIGYFVGPVTNPTLLKDFHKTQAGNKGMLLIKFRTPTAAVKTDTIIATSSVNGDYGFEVRLDSSGVLKIDQRDGTTTNTTTLASGLTANTQYTIAIGWDYDTDTLYSAVNADTLTAHSPTNWTDAITTDATDNFIIGADGDETAPLDAGVQLYGIWLVNKIISNAELAAWRDYADAYYIPDSATAPGQVTNLVAQPAAASALLAWDANDDGGSSITDYLVEYKASSSGTWLEFSHTASTAKSITVTGLTNGTAYDFRVSAINSVGTGTASSTASTTPAAGGTDPYDESVYKLTLPTNSSGGLTGSAAEILQPDLLTYSSAYFVRGDGTFTFNCPDGGATTSGDASYARSEFRHIEDIAYNVATEDELDVTVTALPLNHKTVIHQIHGLSQPPWFKTQWIEKGPGLSYIYVLVKNLSGGTVDGTANDSDFPAVTLKSGLTLGDRVVLKVKYTGTALQFYVDGVLVHSKAVSQNPTYAGTHYYWKRGNYYQNNARVGNICTVVHYTNPNNYIGS